jgi:phospho-N-acetylmuramoyl-pentapeptide-transferase
MKRKALYQTIRDDIIIHTFAKQKKPTMGGIFANISILLSCLFFTNLNIYIKQLLIISISFGLIGYIDDYIKVFKKNTNGFKGSIKIILELLIVTSVIVYSTYNNLYYMDGILNFPFNFSLNLGIFQDIFLILMIVGSANAVNITDGLDGLIIIPIILIAFIYTFYTNDKNIINVCYSIIGSGVAFFILNKYPSKIFMGDVGSLFYGSLLSFISILIRKEILYTIFAILFIVETLTTIIQVFSHFFFGKKIFLSAPLHHHFEKQGWSERKIIFIFWFFFFLCLLTGIFLYSLN